MADHYLTRSYSQEALGTSDRKEIPYHLQRTRKDSPYEKPASLSYLRGKLRDGGYDQ